MKPMEVLKLIIAIAVCFGASGLGALFIGSDSITTWYAKLQKPAITPPDWVFGPVWTVLYLLMAISVFIIWNKGLDQPKVKIAIILFFIQLALNAAWTPIFFGFHLILPALVDIVALFLAILATTLVFSRISSGAAILLIPYLIWVGFAAVLNGFIWHLNR